LLHGFADRLQAGEVNDCVDPVRGEQGVEGAGIADVGFDEVQAALGIRFDA